MACLNALLRFQFCLCCCCCARCSLRLFMALKFISKLIDWVIRRRLFKHARAVCRFVIFLSGQAMCALATIHAAATQCCHNSWCVIGSVLKRVNCVFSSFSNWFDSMRGLTHEPKSERRLLFDSVMRINDSSWALSLHNLISIRGQPNSLSPFLTLTHSPRLCQMIN